MSYIGTDPFDEESKQPSEPPSEPPTLLFGLCIAVLLVCMPAWSARTLLADDVVSYFITKWPLLLLLSCGSLLFLALFAVGLWRCWRGGHRVGSGEPAINVLALFVIVYAALMVAMSYLLAEQAHGITEEVRYTCGGGQHTHLLYEEYLRLSQLRTDPSCASAASVANCSGFVPTKEAGVLQQFEKKFSCSGFCSQFVGWNHSLAPVPFAVENTWRLRSPSQEAVAIYPPALFSHRNSTASCSGMSMRNAAARLGDVSDETFWEGVLLCFLCSVAGAAAFTNMISLSGGPRRWQNKGGSFGYGTIRSEVSDGVPFL